MTTYAIPDDAKTAQAFATSWNNLPGGSVYTKAQFEDWLAPLTQADIEGRTVLELGCGNGSLIVHMTSWNPSLLTGVDLGDSVQSAENNLRTSGHGQWKVQKADLTSYQSQGFDLVYCIGVLHHLKDPYTGFESVVRNTNRGGKFHAWVYAREGNTIVVFLVDPLRKIVSRLPWWFTKYFVATPLVVPYYIYAKALSALKHVSFLKTLPLYEYSLWIAQRDFAFFRHVAFDQLVTPQTTYIRHGTLEKWLTHPNIKPGSTYIVRRNGNSWKFGGIKVS